MHSTQTARAYYDLLGKNLQSHVDPSQTAQEVTHILSLLKSDDTVLDVGCGYGRITHELLKRGVLAQGCDVSEEMVMLANDKCFRVADMCALPYDDKEFSVSICVWSGFNSLLSQAEQLQALKEMIRVSSRLVFIDVPDGDDREHRFDIKKRGTGVDKRIVKNYFRDFPNAIYVHDSVSMAALCQELGCEYTISRQSFGGRQRLLVSVRP